jgi:hypothetical protein
MTLTSLHESRAYGPAEFFIIVQNAFCDTIRGKADTPQTSAINRRYPFRHFATANYCCERPVNYHAFTSNLFRMGLSTNRASATTRRFMIAVTTNTMCQLPVESLIRLARGTRNADAPFAV